MSKHLNGKQVTAINKIGDAMIPGEEGLPLFSQTGCVRDVDRILDYMPAQDISDLKTLLSILAFFPGFLIAWVMGFLEWALPFPGPVGGLLRLIRIGLRGLIFTLYYSNERITGQLGYDVGVFKADLPGRS